MAHNSEKNEIAWRSKLAVLWFYLVHIAFFLFFCSIVLRKQLQVRKALIRGRTNCTFRSVLLICSSQFSYAFSATLPELVFFISLSCTDSLNLNIFFLWHWTLTYDIDLRIWPIFGQDQPACQISSSEIILFQNFISCFPESRIHKQRHRTACGLLTCRPIFLS